MARKSIPVVPEKTLPRPLYELLRRLSQSTQITNNAVAALGRGEGIIVDLSKYFYLPGRQGGQIGHGANGPAGTLTLSSTADLTRGYVYLGANHVCAYDETNGRLGIGLG